jgi:hypothetical protein
MNRRRIKSSLLAVLAVTAMAVVPAFGANRHRVTVFHDVTVGKTKLARGEYLLKWETHSPEATVTIQGYGKVQGTEMGKVVVHNEKFDQDVIVESPDENGSMKVVEIRFGGTNKSIVFGES